VLGLGASEPAAIAADGLCQSWRVGAEEFVKVFATKSTVLGEDALDEVLMKALDVDPNAAKI
jgi:hypothetical protein